jgi:hypothetical protein
MLQQRSQSAGVLANDRAEQKLHAKAAAEKQQSITLVNQSFDERKIVVLRSDA